jgi:hypothetical protein
MRHCAVITIRRNGHSVIYSDLESAKAQYIRLEREMEDFAANPILAVFLYNAERDLIEGRAVSRIMVP